MSRKTKHRTKSRLADGRHRQVIRQLHESQADAATLAELVLGGTSQPGGDVAVPTAPPARQRVVGIGGLFFKAHDPDTLSYWYARHLGVGAPPVAFEEANWAQEPGPTVFAPFGPEHWDSAPLGSMGWGINFRVDDLDAMVDQLRTDGVDVDVDDEVAPNGRFAQLRDPEGNRIQLWQPI